jgi:hypothetical protein
MLTAQCDWLLAHRKLVNPPVLVSAATFRFFGFALHCTNAAAEPVANCNRLTACA